MIYFFTCHISLVVLCSQRLGSLVAGQTADPEPGPSFGNPFAYASPVAGDMIGAVPLPSQPSFQPSPAGGTSDTSQEGKEALVF